MLTIRASIAERLWIDPFCFGPMAPVVFPAAISRAVRIFWKVLLMHEGSEIGLWFLGFVVSVRPCFGIGTHFAIFQLGGYVPCPSRLVKSWRSSVGDALVGVVTML